MPRKIAVLNSDQNTPVLEETEAPEEELQEALKLNPELLPVEELGVNGPLMMVGRETSLSSGSVDLLGVGRGGEVVVIEFKTGPQNADFRSAAAQLLDYGAQLWGMSYEDFESSVALRYFGAGRCPPGSPVRGVGSLAVAARATWPDLTDDDLDVFRRGLSKQLEGGGFRYVLAAQRFTPTMEATLGYLNSQLLEARFYGVELIRFTGGALAVLEARTILRPENRPGSGVYKRRQTLDERQFLDKVQAADYREAVEHFLSSCRSLGLGFTWGCSSVSLKVVLPTSGKPVTVAWLFPPGVSGWMGLTDLTAGYDPTKSDEPTVRAAFEAYLGRARQLPGATPSDRAGLKAVHIDPASAQVAFPGIVDAILELTREIGVG